MRFQSSSSSNDSLSLLDELVSGVNERSPLEFGSSDLSDMNLFHKTSERVNGRETERRYLIGSVGVSKSSYTSPESSKGGILWMYDPQNQRNSSWIL